MYATRVAAFALVAALGLVMPAKADFFANFFDDANCSVNGGEGVNIKNPGCLSGSGGRGSVYIPNTGLGPFPDNQFCLVITSDAGCDCQNEGFNFKATGFCHQLNPSDKSYRFISGACASNNC